MFYCCYSKKTVCADSPIALTNLDSSVNWNGTIPFVPPISSGQVIKVYDGDTITIAAKLPYAASPMYRFSVRLNGIDCPEIRGKNDQEKEIAQIAKKRLSDLILNKIVFLSNVKTEKYGRMLADITYNGVQLNQFMINERLAVAYDGGTKISPVCWKAYYESGIHESCYAPSKPTQFI
jgi:micrococcal nuclease